MEAQNIYRKYSDYLKQTYGQKVYKLPINLPVSCPNRVKGRGCSFCAETGTGFESLSETKSVTEQLAENKEYIMKRYKAKKFIAYFQNYTNTFLPIDKFREYVQAAAATEDIVEISISTRPDCVSAEYLDCLAEIKEQYKIGITMELGLQTANYHTLDKINRGHGLAEFISCVLQVSAYKFNICTHVILNLPWDNDRDGVETAKIISALPIHIVKVHSLYIPKNTMLCEQYENDTITVCSKDEYIRRLGLFIEYLRPDIVVERIFGRAPEDDVVFSNWNTSWWKLQDEFFAYMKKIQSVQGSKFDYLNGSGLKLL